MPRDPNSRLVYSTGGDKDPEKTEEKPGPESRKTGVRIRLERRASGRLVTVLTGLPGTADEVASLAKALKTACGAGGAVKDDGVEIQGDQRERVEAVLSARGLKWKRAGG